MIRLTLATLACLVAPLMAFVLATNGSPWAPVPLFLLALSVFTLPRTER